MRLALILPAPLSRVSGGYAYARRMLAELAALGHAVRALELPGRFPLPDAEAEAAAAAALADLAPGERCLVDGLALPAFAAEAGTLARIGASALIHHPTALETGAPRDILEPVERRLFAACARLVATSPATARTLCEWGVAPQRIAVVEPGTDPAPRASGSGGPGCRILSVGALIPRKGHDVLLRALARLTDLDWRLGIAGPPADPVHADGLAALAEELGLAGRVAFLGALDDAALAAEYDRADLFALATWHEGYGMVAAEAQARGLPLALCTGGAVAEVAGPGAAILSPPGDHASLSRGLRRAICDPALRAQMAEASWQAGQRLPRWPAQAAKLAEALEAGHG